MRLVVLLLFAVLAACDLQPPKREPPPPVTPPPSAVASDAAIVVPRAPDFDAAVAVEPVVDAGIVKTAVDAMDVSQPCLDVSVHIADVVIASIPDAAAKAALEQDRTKLVRRAAETCTRDSWNPAAIACFTKAKDTAALEVCGKDLKAP